MPAPWINAPATSGGAAPWANAPSFTPLTSPNPKLPLDLKHMQGANDLQRQELARQGALNAKASADAAEAAARARYAEQLAKAQRDKAVADAAIAQQNAAGAAGTGLAPASNVHGAQYLKALPEGLAATVKAVASGNVMLPANALKTPYWQQVLQHTLNYDPEFNAADFNTRARTRQDFANGKMGINITALNTALGHAGEVLGDVKALNNAGGIGTTLWNPIANAYLRHTGDPRVTNFENDTMAFGGELAKVFAGSQGGGQAEREEWRTSVPINGSPAQQIGVLTHDAKLLRSRIEAINEQYKRGMGRTADISDLLDPHARHVYTTLLAGDPPPAAGDIPGGPPSPGSPPNAPGAPTISLANGQSRIEPDAQGSKIIDAMIRSGATDDQIDAALTAIGSNKIDRSQAASARAYLRKNPTYKGSFGGAERAVPTTAWNRFAASPTGTAIYSAVDAGMGGLTDEMASLVGGGDLADLNARKQALFAQNPGAAFAGQAVGTMGAMAGMGAIGRGAGIASRFANPQLMGDLAFGAASGAGQSNDNRLIGAALGAGGGAAGNAIGTGLAGGVGVIARTRPALAVRNRIRGLFGRSPLETPNALSDHEKMLLAGFNRAGPDNVRGALTEAQSLGIPMSLADANPNLRELAGAAVRRSPSAASFAEDALIPRNRGQIDRFGAAVNRDLGPTANIPQTSADLMRGASEAAAPLYAKAYANPVVSTPELDSLLATPAGKQALARAQTIAANERRDPQSMGFSLDANGDVVLNPVPQEALGRLGQAESDAFSAEQALKRAQAGQLNGGVGNGTSARSSGPTGTTGMSSQQAEQAVADAEAALRRAQTGQLTGAGGSVRTAELALAQAKMNLGEINRSQLAGSGSAGSGSYRPTASTAMTVTEAQAAHDAAQQALAEARANMAAQPMVGTAASTPGYTTQTLDYVKRGIDDVIDNLPKGLNGRPIMDENYRAVDKVRRELLREVDRINPDYGVARAAYAGPASSRDALERGMDAIRLTPDELGVQVGAQSPEQLAQMQLGYRSALMDRANAIRDVGNPFEATLGSPSARGRIDALYPGNPGTANLFRQRDLEQGLQRTTNDILGNSKTAQRTIADNAFATNPLLEGALHAGAAYASGGASIPGTAARMIGTGLRDRMKLGMGERATRRADALIPQLLDIDPASSITRLDDLLARQQAYQALVQATTPRRALGFFGRGIGSQAAVAPLNY